MDKIKVTTMNIKSQAQGFFPAFLWFLLIALAIAPLDLLAVDGFDLSRDFSIASNPNGVWSYGSAETLGGQFTACAFPRSSGSTMSPESWEFTEGHWPAIYHNPTTNVLVSDGGQGTYPPGAVWYAAGENGTSRNFGVIRFTVPEAAAGTWRIEAAVRSHLDGPRSSDTDFHVMKNGLEMFGQFLPPQSSTGYTNFVALAAGDTIDFAIGRGADGIQYGSALKIQAVISPAPDVTLPPSILAQSSNQVVLARSSVTLSVQATGSEPLTYQWSFGSGLLNGATNATLVLSNVQSSQAGTFSVAIINAVGGTTSAPIVLAVIEPPPPSNPGVYDLQRDFSIQSNPNGVWSYGSATTLGGAFTPCAYARASGSSSSPESWEFTAGVWPAVYHNPTTNTIVSDGGQGVFPPGTVWYAAGEDGTPRNFGVIRFKTPEAAGGNFQLEVAVRPHLDGPDAGDTDFHVLKNGVEIFGQFLSAQGRTGYTNLLALAAGDTIDFAIGRGADGRQYGSGLKIQAVISSAANAVFPPAIYTQTADQSVTAGCDVTFNVMAGGSEPLSFQWYFNTALLDGATNATLAISNVQPSQDGVFLAVITNTAGAVTSAPMVLAVTEPPQPGSVVYDLQRDFSIGSNPNGAWAYGSAATLGGPFTPLSYSRVSQGSDGVPNEAWEFTQGHWPAVFHNASTNTATSDGGQGVFPPGTVWYAAGENGTTRNFGVIRLTVPRGLGGEYWLDVAVRSHLDGPLAGDTDFHVLRNGVELFGQFLPAHSQSGYTNLLALAGGDTIDFAVGRGADGLQYGSGLKIQAVLSMATNTTLPPTILALTPDQTITKGSDVALSVQAVGAQPLWYQWFLNTSLIEAGTNDTLFIANVQAEQAGSYSVVVGNEIGSVTSAPIRLVVTEPPVPGPIVYDLQHDFSIAANPNGVWSYGSAETLGGQFTACAFPRSSGSTMSPESWEFTEGRWPAIYHNPTPNVLISDDGQGTFPPGTVWYAAGEDGTTRNFGVIRFTLPEGPPGTYQIQVAARSYLDGPRSGDADIHVLKNGVELFGQFLPSQSQTAYTNQMILAGGDTLDFAIGRGEDGLQYGSALKIQALLWPVTNGIAEPRIVFLSTDQTVSLGDKVTLAVEAIGSTPLAYQWLLADNPIQGATGPALSFSSVQTRDAGSYTVVVSNVAGTSTSAPVVVRVLLPEAVAPAITGQPYSRNAYPGGSASFEVTATGTAPLAYQWYWNGVALPDATNRTLVLTNLQPAQAGTYTVTVANFVGTVGSRGAVLNVQVPGGGTVQFANSVGTNRAYIFDVDGTTRLEGPAFLVQMYAGPTLDSLQPIGAAVPFLSGGQAGLFSGGTRYIASVTPGEMATIIVKAWPAQFGSSYEQAVAAGSRVGASVPFTVTTGGVSVTPITPPSLPAQLAGLQSFSLNFATGPAPMSRSKLVAAPRTAPHIGWPNRTADGTLYFILDGEFGASYDVQTSPDLKNWTSLTQILNVTGPAKIVDSEAGHWPQRFYRARVLE